MTTYQESTAPSQDLLGLPIGLLEYYSMHPDGSGDLILLAMPISNVSVNYLPHNQIVWLEIEKLYKKLFVYLFLLLFFLFFFFADL